MMLEPWSLIMSEGLPRLAMKHSKKASVVRSQGGPISPEHEDVTLHHGGFGSMSKLEPAKVQCNQSVGTHTVLCRSLPFVCVKGGGSGFYEYGA